MGLMDSLASLFQGGAPPPPQPEGPPKPIEGSLVPKDVGGDKVVHDQEPMEALPDPSAIVLQEEQQQEIRSIVHALLSQSNYARRAALQRVLRGRDYLNNKMGLVWDDGLLAYQPLSNIDLGQYELADEEDDIADVVLNWNIYQAAAGYLCAALTSSRPTVRFWPQGAQVQDDIDTAQSSNDILDLFYRVNKIQTLQDRMGRILYTDGVWYAYVRHVVDGQRFGFHMEDIVEDRPTEIRPPGMECQNCDQFTPMAQAQSLVPGGGPACQCGAPLDPNSVTEPIIAMTPQVVGQKQVANGAELMDIFGVPEVRVPPEANDIPDCSYVCLQTECDPEFLMALYSDKADEIRHGTMLAEDTLQEDRQARLALKTGAASSSGRTGPIDGANEKVTFTRIWLRPYVLYKIIDDVERDAILKQFPRGIFFAFAGDVFCEARNESMDDYWVKCHAYDGDGMVRPSIGEILLDPQDALNDLMDSEVNAARHAVPFTLIDEDLLASSKFRNTKARGGAFYPVALKDDKGIGQQVYSTATPALPASTSQLREWIFGTGSQWLTGTLPGMTGQGDPDLKTKGAYLQAKEQALGRLGIPWRNLQAAFVKIAELVVRHYIDNRNYDVSFPSKTPIGFENRTIKISSLQGQAVAFAENEETYPVTMGQKKDNFNTLAQSGSPIVAGAMQSPENYALIKSLNALTGLVLPGEAARKKQLREIGLLTQSAPIMPSPPPPMPMAPPDGSPPSGGGAIPPDAAAAAPGPTVGESAPTSPAQVPPPVGPPMPPPPPPEPMPSIPVDVTDEHQGEFAACQSWLQSDEAWDMLQTNPMGILNVQLHAKMHLMAMMPPPGAPPPGPPGKGPQ